jgi:hypothetical protein
LLQVLQMVKQAERVKRLDRFAQGLLLFVRENS